METDSLSSGTSGNDRIRRSGSQSSSDSSDYVPETAETVDEPDSSEILDRREIEEEFENELKNADAENWSVPSFLWNP